MWCCTSLWTYDGDKWAAGSSRLLAGYKKLLLTVQGSENNSLIKSEWIRTMDGKIKAKVLFTLQDNPEQIGETKEGSVVKMWQISQEIFSNKSGIVNVPWPRRCLMEPTPSIINAVLVWRLMWKMPNMRHYLLGVYLPSDSTVPMSCWEMVTCGEHTGLMQF